ncbi:MAG: LuxR C-terminal-related transcriptional regulator [Bacteroidetes bacterium]|nr:LuxR C-terminal-related transcriptional regulator [Bacteroidota bacterium]
MKSSNQDIQNTIDNLYHRFFKNNGNDYKDVLYQEELHNPYFKLIPEAFHVFNLITKKLEYVSPNYKHVMGWSAEEMMAGGPGFMLTTIHPNHAKLYNDQILLSMFRQFSAHCLSNDPSAIKFSLTVKCRRSNGDYDWILNTIIVHKSTMKVIPMTVISFLNNINHFKQDEAITFNVLKKNKEGNFRVVKTQRFYNFDNKVSLTKKELSVLYLLKTNNSTEEIATELHLSKRTVYNYRNSLLKKMQVNNVHQLIHVSQTNGLI